MSTTIHLPLPGPRSRWLGTGALAALLVVALATPPLVPLATIAVDPSPQAREHTISVSGTGRVTLAPDVTDLRLGVQVTKRTVKEARDVAAATMTRVIAALKAAGIADRDIQTTILSLQPVYTYPSDGSSPKLTGYQLTNTVAATIRSLNRLADAVDAAMTAGATAIEGITFRVDDPRTAQSQARMAAMADAKAKAQALASAANVSIIGVASISESSSIVSPPVPHAALLRDEVATPIQPGVSEVQVDVSVMYLID